MDLKEIRQIIEMMKRHDLSLFHMEREGFKLKLRKGADYDETLATHAGPAPIPTVIASVEATPSAILAPAVNPVAPVNFIQSPMVGTFYRASSPDDKPFVNVGDKVEEGTTVCIIEAMKVMNEIKAEKSGIITRVVAVEATPVQYESNLFEITPV